MRVGVTGAAGYLGRPLVAALARDERVEEVVAIDRRPVAADAGVIAVQRDVRDPELARDLDGVDALVHLAAVVLGRGRDAHSVNVDGSRNAFAGAVSAGVRTIVHASSAAAYGCAAENPVPLSEDSPLRPVPRFYYPETKVAAERLLDEHERRRPELRVVRLRPVANLGPGAPLALGGRVFASLREYDPLIQFVWVDDTVSAFTAALHSDVRGAFNVAAPSPVRTSAVAGLLGVRALRLPYRLARAAARAGSALRAPGALHPGWVDMGRYPIVVDTARAERELGWRASCDCEQALRRFGSLLRSGPNRRGVLVRAEPAPGGSPVEYGRRGR